MEFNTICNREYNFEDVKEHARKLGKNYMFSYNCKNVVNEDTKYIIVGTITPKYEGRSDDRTDTNAMNSCYFYNGKNNWMYEILDYVKEDESGVTLVKLKDELPSSETVGEIKRILKNKKIAFLDVIEAAVMESEYDTQDKKIEYFSLDYEAFRNVINICNDVKFIPNSNAALYALKIILKQIDESYIEKIIYDPHRPEKALPQRLRGRGAKGRTKDSLKQDWKTAIGNI